MGRGLPPWAGMRGRPPMGYMRFPRGMHMRGMRPPPGAGGFMPPELEEEEEDTEMSEKDDGSGNGPKSLMSIKTPKHIKESVKTQIVSQGPQMAPLGMGMGPRYHAMRGGIRPPPGAGPPPPMGGPPPPMPTRSPAPGSVNPSTSRGGKPDHHHHPRGHHPNITYHPRGSLKRPAPSSLSHEGQRPNKLMATSFNPTTNNAPPSSRTNLRYTYLLLAQCTFFTFLLTHFRILNRKTGY